MDGKTPNFFWNHSSKKTFKYLMLVFRPKSFAQIFIWQLLKQRNFRMFYWTNQLRKNWFFSKPSNQWKFKIFKISKGEQVMEAKNLWNEASRMRKNKSFSIKAIKALNFWGFTKLSIDQIAFQRVQISLSSQIKLQNLKVFRANRSAKSSSFSRQTVQISKNWFKANQMAKMVMCFLLRSSSNEIKRGK